MSAPRLTEVYGLEEKKVAIVQCPDCGGHHIANVSHAVGRKRSSPVGKAIRGATPTGQTPAEDDPFKDSPMAEHFASPKGEYFLTKIGSGYKAQFISRRGEYEDLGYTPARATTIDVVLAHHDRQMAGL